MSASARALLISAFREAIDLAEDGWQYAPEYLREKWDVADDLARLRAIHRQMCDSLLSESTQSPLNRDSERLAPNHADQGIDAQAASEGAGK